MSIDARALDVGFLGALWAEIGDVARDARRARRGVGHARRAAAGRLGAARRRPARAARRSRAATRRALELRVDGDEARLTRLAATRRRRHARRHRARAARRASCRRSCRCRRARTRSPSPTARPRRASTPTSTIAGDRTDGVFHGQLALSRGSLELPDLSGLGAADELGRPATTSASTTRARAATRGARRAGKGAFIVVRVDGPLELRSKEADLDLAGELGVTVAGGALGIEGVVEAQRGIGRAARQALRRRARAAGVRRRARRSGAAPARDAADRQGDGGGGHRGDGEEPVGAAVVRAAAVRRGAADELDPGRARRAAIASPSAS